MTESQGYLLGEDAMLAEIERLRGEINGTIERCAQVAEECNGMLPIAIAAAIRKLKDKP